MEWKSNASYNKELTDGTIFNNKQGISIHRIVGIEGNWYLSCVGLNISTKFLSDGSFDEAVLEAKKIISNELAELNKKYANFVSDESENVIVSWFSKE